LASRITAPYWASAAAVNLVASTTLVAFEAPMTSVVRPAAAAACAMAAAAAGIEACR